MHKLAKHEFFASIWKFKKLNDGVWQWKTMKSVTKMQWNHKILNKNVKLVYKNYKYQLCVKKNKKKLWILIILRVRS